MNAKLFELDRQEKIKQATQHFTRAFELIASAITMPATEPSETSFYSSSKLGTLPPGCVSPRNFRDRCRIGDLRAIATRDRGVWLVEKSAYVAHVASVQSRASVAEPSEAEADARREKSVADAFERAAKRVQK